MVGSGFHRGIYFIMAMEIAEHTASLSPGLDYGQNENESEGISPGRRDGNDARIFEETPEHDYVGQPIIPTRASDKHPFDRNEPE